MADKIESASEFVKRHELIRVSSVWIADLEKRDAALRAAVLEEAAQHFYALSSELLEQRRQLVDSRCLDNFRQRVDSLIQREREAVAVGDVIRSLAKGSGDGR